MYTLCPFLSVSDYSGNVRCHLNEVFSTLRISENIYVYRSVQIMECYEGVVYIGVYVCMFVYACMRARITAASVFNNIARRTAVVVGIETKTHTVF